LAFRGKTDQPQHAFKLRGLDPNATYELSYEDAAGVPSAASGQDLTARGLAVRLAEAESSELVWFRRK